jgi:hypothetical protein
MSLLSSLAAGADGVFGIMTGNTDSLGAYPDGTSEGAADVNNGINTDTLAQTASLVAQTVPIWTSNVLGLQSQNQLSTPTFAGLGTEPGLTSGAGTLLPGPQSPGGAGIASSPYLPYIAAGLIIFLLVVNK